MLETLLSNPYGNPLDQGYVAGYEYNSVVDGPGTRFTVFFQGCFHECFGCHNPSTHPMGAGTPTFVDDVVALYKRASLTTKVTISGGDPFYQPHFLYTMLKALRGAGVSNIWAYTGFGWHELLNYMNRAEGIPPHQFVSLLSLIDVVVDGPFVLDMKSMSCPYRGSTNQQLIDVPATLKAGSPVLWEVKA